MANGSDGMHEGQADTQVSKCYNQVSKCYKPLTVLQKILLGARKWYGPREGFVFILLRRKSKYFSVNTQNNSTLSIMLNV